MVAGIISGACHYFGFKDPLPWRIIFFLLCIFTYAGFIIAYLIVWALVPEARTAEERLKMKGEPVNPKTINEEIMRGVNKTKEFVQCGRCGKLSCWNNEERITCGWCGLTGDITKTTDAIDVKSGDM